MNIKKVTASLAILIAVVIMTACGGGGGDSKSNPTNPPASTTPAPPTTAEMMTGTPPVPPPTTAETTTTTPDYSYELVLDRNVEYINGEYWTTVVDDGTLPLDAVNPEHPEGLNLRAFSNLVGNDVCFHGWGQQGDIQAKANGIAKYQYFAGSMTEPQGYLSVYVTDMDGVPWHWDATEAGVAPKPSGEWSAVAFVTPGVC